MADTPFEEPDFSKLGTAEAEDEFDADELDDDLEDEEDEDLEEDDDDDLEDDEEAVAEDLVDEGNVAEANTAARGSAASVLEHIAASIVDDKESVVVDVEESRGQTRLNLHVAPSDMGRIIGRRGRTAQAVRTIVRAAAAAEGRSVFVDIVD